MRLPRRFYVACLLVLTAATLLTAGPPASLARSQPLALEAASSPAAPLSGPEGQGGPSAGRPLVNRAAHFDVSAPLRSLAAARPATSAAPGAGTTPPLVRRPTPTAGGA